ncbi:tRNA 2-thiouridine(34) synthase MnmA [Desulfurivibrio dismutans]|uniref:tRNA 2-thiouridine(34) synthase MnmA n=1 Tax=Desulfurivibrio dismutans TaxID=1398908 RepID=UPI0023DC64F0|nr:tRNA 2-thiouridine(34) synthase MnmA [Desulfurivibrio alkaliphilus]MDF1614035.1 tRNA 2-thiouridine(34) synthase MnmA [Desulfurivibrio alkaliphilus]
MLSDQPSLYQKRIAVAMSGGVDSSVTAALLLQAGAEVEGVFMRLAQPGIDDHQRRVEGVAAHLGIPLTVLDLSESFAQKVLQPFVAAYLAGVTPNPCVFCNRQIKFGLLLEAMLARRADFLATGHYVRLTPAPPGIAGAAGATDADDLALRRGGDPRKDQSYFLCRLKREVLPRILFPLGEKRKTEVYEMAAGLGLSGRHGPESQDVCFLGGQSVADFLTAYVERAEAEQNGPVVAAEGLIVTVEGRQVGRHRGVFRYTIGQRRGLGIPDATPYYVVALDVKANRVVVGKPEDLLRRQIRLADLNWLIDPPRLPGRFTVQLRHRHRPAPALVEAAADGTITLTFDQPQRAPAPGQYAALYHDDQLLAGGEILPLLSLSA